VWCIFFDIKSHELVAWSVILWDTGTWVVSDLWGLTVYFTQYCWEWICFYYFLYNNRNPVLSKNDPHPKISGSGNTTKGLHMQLADKTTMIHSQQLKNYVFHVFVGKFTNVPQIHVVFHE
jgi:hypothetical protein